MGRKGHSSNRGRDAGSPSFTGAHKPRALRSHLTSQLSSKMRGPTDLGKPFSVIQKILRSRHTRASFGFWWCATDDANSASGRRRLKRPLLRTGA